MSYTPIKNKSNIEAKQPIPLANNAIGSRSQIMITPSGFQAKQYSSNKIEKLGNPSNITSPIISSHLKQTNYSL